MKSKSPKHRFLENVSDEQDFFDNLIRVERTAYSPSPMGDRVHRSLARTRILIGGLGSGKTRCATEHINTMALAYPGSTYVIARKNIPDLKATTQREFLEFVVSPETIETFNVNDNILYYKNGSKVLFKETKTPGNFKSYEISGYLLDEADENETEEVWFVLNQRLREKVYSGGQRLHIPFCGLLVLNPVSDQHWLYQLAHRRGLDLETFKFRTYENRKNLPDGYIEELEATLDPLEKASLLDGEWGQVIKGKPVIHGFTESTHVRVLRVNPSYPLFRGWDFGFNHPCVSFAQIDPLTGRFFKLREFYGDRQYLKDVVPEVQSLTRELVGANYPVFDFGDPHGADQKDTGESSIEYLRVHHGIFVQHKRTRIVTGLEEIQHKVLTDAPLSADDTKNQAPLFLVDPSCRWSILAYKGKYHRDDFGVPVKDDVYDHPVDTDRYIIVNQMNSVLAQRHKQRRYIPRSTVTGY